MNITPDILEKIARKVLAMRGIDPDSPSYQMSLNPVPSGELSWKRIADTEIMPLLQILKAIDEELDFTTL